MSGDSQSRTHDLLGAAFGVAALVLLAFAPVLVDTSGPDPFYKGPLIFPLLALSLIVAGALPSLWRLLRPLAGQRWYLDGHGLPWRGLGMLGLLALYPAGLWLAGLQIASLGFVAAGLVVAGERRPGRVAFVALITTLALHLVFRTALDIWFPTPLLFALVGA